MPRLIDKEEAKAEALRTELEKEDDKSKKVIKKSAKKK